MNFLPDVYVLCEVCNGKRYNRETLEILYKTKSISNILDMTIEEALNFFEDMPALNRKIKALNDVGLGYIKLGQQATTLSGGEAQRVKLATELSKIGTGKTIYILDEPTTGLHFEDVSILLTVLNRLVDKGLVQRTGLHPASYQAVIQPDAVSRGDLDSLVRHVTFGQVVPLVAHLVKDRNLSADEIRELKQLIDDAEQTQRQQKISKNKKGAS